MHLFTTDFQKSDPDDAVLLRKLGVPEGMPFFLDDKGNYVSTINEFLRYLPTDRVPSRHSWMAYARDILTWDRFLREERGIANIWHASREDVRAYHNERRVVDPETAIAASSWNRSVAALDRLYRWGLDEGLVEALPFSYSYAVRFLEEQYVISVNRSKEKGAKNPTMRFFTPQQYVQFRNIGILGQNPDGTVDLGYRGRSFERNAALCELLVTTGLRIAEANALCTFEISGIHPNGTAKSVPFILPAAITKGKKARQILLPQRVVKQIRSYCAVERAEAVRSAQSLGLYDQPKWIVFRHSNQHSGVRPDGKRVKWAKLPPERRRLIVLEDAEGQREPLNLWLSAAGKPVTESAWNKIFRRAASRCERLGFPIDAYPHKLRHTFATNMRDMLKEIGYSGNPMRLIQLLLGHASIETTSVYADASPEILAATAEVADDWSELLKEMELITK